MAIFSRGTSVRAASTSEKTKMSLTQQAIAESLRRPAAAGEAGTSSDPITLSDDAEDGDDE